MLVALQETAEERAIKDQETHQPDVGYKPLLLIRLWELEQFLSISIS